MSEIDRLYRYKTLLSHRRAMPREDILAALEISPATFKRDLAKLRDRLGTIAAPQARNKTRWVQSLCPVPGAVRTGMHIDPLNKDSVFAATGAWITEAGELDTTTRKSDAGALKAFFTRCLDVLRPPYAKRENEYKRRTVFVGTVNGTGFLHDTTGNRRYWTIAVDRCVLLEPSQMQQVWAEYLHKYQHGARWFLDTATQEALNKENLEHTATEPLRDLISSKFDWQSVKWAAIEPEGWRDHPEVAWLTATAICEKVGYSKVTRPLAHPLAHGIAHLT